MQHQRPITYFSQALPSRARSKSIYETKFMAIIFAVQKWKHYLTGRHFVVQIDQKSLKFSLEQRLVNEEHQKWLTKLLGFDFNIEYKPRLENKIADALSRIKLATTLITLSIPCVLQQDELSKAVKKDPELSQILTALQADPSSCVGFALIWGALLYHEKLALPKDFPFVLLALQEGHDRQIKCDGSFLKTYKRIAKTFYWRGTKKDIRDYVAACATYEQNAYSTLMLVGLLQPLTVPERVWDDISTDFIESLPKSDGFNSILVVVDRLNRYITLRISNTPS